MNMEFYWESYRLQNQETRQRMSSACSCGYQWVWQTFSECIVTEAEVAGYVTGSLSLIFVLVSWILYLAHACTTTQAVRTILVFNACIDAVSLIGAVLSMQMMILILWDLVSVAISLLLLVVVSGVVLVRRYSKHEQYRAVLDGQFAVSTPKSLFEVTSYKVCILPVCLVLAALAISMTTSLQRWSGTSSSKQGATMEIKDIVLMTAIGYTLACLACFGQWILELMLMKFTMSSGCSRRAWQWGAVTHLLSDVTYILGVLLQSGGLNVTLTTLPWLVRRFLQAGVQICKFKSTKWALSCFMSTQRQPEKPGQPVNGDGDDDDVIDFESAKLLARSESGPADVDHAYDRPWQVVDKQGALTNLSQEEPTYKRELPLLQNECSALTTCYCVASTTESDWTSTSQEQELAWDHSEVTSSQQNDVGERPFRHLCQLTRPTQESTFTLDFSSSQTYTERVISWISKSTPEEETPPCLTLTLNLDSSQTDRSGEADMKNFGDRKIYSGGTLLSPRKNSF